MLSSLRSYHTDKPVLPKILRKTVLIALVLLFTWFAQAQDAEIGFELGAYNNLGDVTKKYDLGNSTLGMQAFYRKHLNNGFSTRISGGFGKLKGKDVEAFDVFSANRQASFSGNFFNVDLTWEYHFLDYRNEKLQQFWSPYILFGVGLYRFSGQDGLGQPYSAGINLRIPVGIGVKYRLNRRWTLSASTTAIKSNTDQLDNVSMANSNLKNYTGGNANDDDWMFNTSISISYTLYKIICPQGRFR